MTTLIALVDTGVDLSSQTDSPYYDLADAWDAYNQTSFNGQDSSLQHGHGSTVADLIVRGIQASKSQPGATTADVKILPIRDTSSGGSLDTNAIIRGVRYAADHGASVINLSLEGRIGSDLTYYNNNNPGDPLNYTTLTQAIQYVSTSTTAADHPFS